MSRYDQFAQCFLDDIAPAVLATYGGRDLPAMGEAWGRYIDGLCRDGTISGEEYSDWVLPES